MLRLILGRLETCVVLGKMLFNAIWLATISTERILASFFNRNYRNTEYAVTLVHLANNSFDYRTSVVAVATSTFLPQHVLQLLANCLKSFLDSLHGSTAPTVPRIPKSVCKTKFCPALR